MIWVDKHEKYTGQWENNLQNGYLGKTKLSLYQKKVKSFTTRVNENSEERKCN